MPDMENNFIAIIPAFNEEKTIGNLVKKTRRFAKKVYVGNDGSEDDTAQKADEAGAIVISAGHRLGKGKTVAGLISRALEENNFKALIIMDGDGQHDPDIIPDFINKYEYGHPDAVFGERKNFSGLPFLRRVWNRLISLLLSAIAGKYWRDTQCGYRLFSRKAAELLIPKSHGYEMETEMFIRAHRLKLGIQKIAINNTRPLSYGAVRKSVFEDFWRAVKITSFIARVLTSNALEKIKNHGHIIALLILAAGIIFQVGIVLNQKYRLFFFPGKGEIYGREISTAMRWLKEHSENEDVILAQWYLGHQIAAFAERPVVATSKVYPSEVKETGKRYIDIANFFFGTDEKEAEKIAGHYGAKFVFVEKNFFAQSCKDNRKCYFANEKQLNRRGLKYTMAGKMSRGAELSFAKPVFNSANFIIYKLTKEPDELSQNEKNTLLKIARASLSSILNNAPPPPVSGFLNSASRRFLSPAALDVSLWTDGKLRGSVITGGKNLPETVVKTVAELPKDWRFKALSQEELGRTRIEIIIFKDDYAPINAASAKKNKDQALIDPSKAMRISGGGSVKNRGYLLSETYNAVNVSNNVLFLSQICKKIKFPENCFYDRKNIFESFSVEDFMETRPGEEAMTMFGTIAKNRPALTKSVLTQSIKEAAEWTLRTQKTDGDFTAITYLYPPETKKTDLTRGSLSAIALIESERTLNQPGLRKLKNSAYIEAAKKHARFALKTLSGDKFKSENSLAPGFMMLENLLLFEITGEKEYLDNALLLQEKIPSITASSSVLEKAATVFILAKFHQAVNSAQSLEKAENIMEDLMKKFPENRILAKEQSMAGNAWLVNAARSLYSLTGEKNYADFGMMVMRWIIDYQNPADEKWASGAFANTIKDDFAYVRGTGKIGEALADAWWLAVKTGENPEPFIEALKENISWLMQMQYGENNSFFIPEERLAEFLGGFRHDYKTTDAWIDSAGHFILAALGLLEIMEKQ